nr:hypothetical protein [Romboutsia ilealis]
MLKIRLISSITTKGILSFSVNKIGEFLYLAKGAADNPSTIASLPTNTTPFALFILVYSLLTSTLVSNLSFPAKISYSLLTTSLLPLTIAFIIFCLKLSI